MVYDRKKGGEALERLIHYEHFMEHVLKVKGKVLVLFYSKYCNDALQVRIAMQHVQEDFPELSLCLVEEHEQELLNKFYGVYVTPTLILFENGKLIDRTIGPRTQDQIRAFCRLT